MQTITSHKPVVVFEHGRGASDAYDTVPSDLFHLLSDTAALRIYDLDGNGPYDRNEFDETFKRNLRWNFVAHA
jgi:hypothetical protein